MKAARSLQGLPSAAALLLALLAVACADTAVAPEDEEPQATPDPQTENVGIVIAEDAIILRGHLFGAQNEVGVVLSHMRPNDQRAWFSFAQELADEGYAALTFDFRGYGETGGDQDFAKLDEDLAAAVRFMRDRGKSPVFLIGASMGGTTSLVVAAEQELAGVVVISAPSTFEDQDGLAAVGAVSAPKLFLASEEDQAAVLSLEELWEAAPDPKERETYSGKAHGTDLLLGEHAEALRERIFRFLREHGGE